MRMRWLRNILIGIGAFILLIGALLVTIILNPEIILNEANLGRAVKYLEDENKEFRWDSAKIKVTNKGILHQTISIAFADLCIKYTPEIEKLCFEKIHVEGEYHVTSAGLQVDRIGPIIFKNGLLHYRVMPSAPSEPLVEIPLPSIQKPSFLQNTFLEQIQINLTEIQVKMDDQTYQATLDLQSRAEDKNSLTTIELSTDVTDLSQQTTAKLTSELKSPSSFLADDWQASLQLSLKIKEKVATTTTVMATKKTDTILYQINNELTNDKIRSQSELTGELQNQKITAELNSSVKLTQQQLTVKVNQCHFSTQKPIADAIGPATEFKCHLYGETGKNYFPKSQLIQENVQNHLDLDISAQLDQFILPIDQHLTGNIELALVPIKQALYEITAHLSADFAGKVQDPLNQWRIDSKYSAEMDATAFEQIVAYLEPTPFAIPAPLNSLKGPANLSINGMLDGITQSGDLNTTLETNLRSKKQQLVLSAQGKVALNLKTETPSIEKVTLEAEIKDAAIELPHLNVLNLPRFVPDPRISVEKAKSEKKPLPFPLSIIVKTSRNDSFKIVNHLTKDPIPFGFNIQLKNDVTTGLIEMDPFPIELFNRKATMETMKIQLQDPVEDSEIMGRIRVDDVDYKIFISVKGTFDRPVVLFQSKPDLSREDIIAVLLYGEPYTALNDDNADSVGNLNAAFSNKAVSMLSLFMLGSTPIQNVGYDPYSKTFSAKLRLGDKTSAKIGTSDKQKQVSLRRRLGKGWGISTTITNSSETKKNEGSAFIEWQKRY